MPKPIGSMSISPISSLVNETPTSPPSPANSSIEAAVPASLRGLLRSRSPVRTRAHADSRWDALPVGSLNEALEHLDGLETCHSLPETHALHIDVESYRQLANSLQARARDLPMDAPLGAATNGINNRGRARAPGRARMDAREAIHRGCTADEAIALAGLTDPRDVATMREEAARVAASGGPRAPASARVAAYSAIERGDTADKAIADNHLTHEDDKAEVRAAAAALSS